MHPVLASFTLGNIDIVISSYSTMLLLAVAACSAGFAMLAMRHGVEFSDVAWFIALVGLAALMGAQVGHALDVWGSPQATSSPLAELSSGHSLAGALLAACGVGWITAKRMGLSPWKLADFSAPGLGLGIAVAKLGCLLQGCCFGRPYAGMLALLFPVGSPAWSWQVAMRQIGPLARPLSVWPVQLIEAAAGLVLGAVALWLILALWPPPGTAFLFFASGYAVVRCGDTFIRAQPSGPIGVLLLSTGAGLCAIVVGMRALQARRVGP